MKTLSQKQMKRAKAGTMLSSQSGGAPRAIKGADGEWYLLRSGIPVYEPMLSHNCLDRKYEG